MLVWEVKGAKGQQKLKLLRTFLATFRGQPSISSGFILNHRQLLPQFDLRDTKKDISISKYLYN